MEAGSCCCGNNGETLIFTCAGASHTGQVANRAGVQAMQQGVGNLFCVAAVAADVPDKMDRTRKAGKRIVIDGCDDHCARKILDKAGMTVDAHIVLTDMGIEKKPAQPDIIGDTKKVTDKVKAAVAAFSS